MNIKPVALLCYGVSMSTFSLANSLEKNGLVIRDIQDIRKGIASFFQKIKRKTGVTLNIDWLPYDGLLSSENADLYETTFIHTMWHTVTGNGFSHINLGEDISASEEEKNAVNMCCELLGLGESSLDELFKGYSLGTGTMANGE